MDDADIVARLNKLYEKHPKLFSDWDKQFVRDNSGRKYYSEKQREIALGILSKVEDDPKKKGETRQEMWDAADVCDKCEEGIVLMRRPLQNAERSRAMEARGTYKRLDPKHQYREAVFACTCGRGALRQQWQRYKTNARDGWMGGWRTPDEFEPVPVGGEHENAV
jgi:hypothetical protein